jgi:hypothetical protein
VSTAERTRVAVDRVRNRDRDFGANSDLLAARMLAVVEAQRAHALHEAGAVDSLRASLIDLAAISEALAGDLRSAGR